MLMFIRINILNKYKFNFRIIKLLKYDYNNILD